MGDIGQLHTPANLLSWKKLRVPTEYEVEWAKEAALTLREDKISYPCQRIEV